MLRKVCSLVLGTLVSLGVAASPVVPQNALRYKTEVIRNSRAVWGLDAPIPIFAAQIHQESGWREDAKSAYASGLTQFTPATADWISKVYPKELSGSSPLNPSWAIRAMVRYDKHLYDNLAVAGGFYDRMWATLRSYNGGQGHWVAEAKKAKSYKREAVDAYCGSARRHVSFCKENLGYPRRIMVVIQPAYKSWGTLPTPSPVATTRRFFWWG